MLNCTPRISCESNTKANTSVLAFQHGLGPGSKKSTSRKSKMSQDDSSQSKSVNEPKERKDVNQIPKSSKKNNDSPQKNIKSNQLK